MHPFIAYAKSLSAAALLPLAVSCLLLAGVIGCTLRKTAATYQQTATTTPARGGIPRQEPQVDLRLAVGPVLQVTCSTPTPFIGQGTTLAVGTHELQVSADRLQLSGVTVGTGVRLQVTTGLLVNGQPVRGSEVHLLAQDGLVHAIKPIALEAYLVGVLAAEVSEGWPAAALEAQAVAARSYATSQVLARVGRPWQLDASAAKDMAYRPEPGAVPRIRQAIQATRGQLLVYQGQVVPAFFSAASGGRSESLAAVWPNRRAADGRTDMQPVFQVVDDPYSLTGGVDLDPQKYNDWEFRVGLDTLTLLLRKWGSQQKPLVQFGTVRGIDIQARTTSGRIATVVVHTSSGSQQISGVELRHLLGSTRMRSLLVRSCSVQGRELVMRGAGFGHGVGLSQVSAYAMGKHGFTASAILAHFYQPASLRRAW
jgi:SpoIID/LytB domain protein